MALQDLTPQLRTRLSRMERAVGAFVLLAIGLLVFGFGYYFYSMAERKGWFKTKAPYYTFSDRATGLSVGDPVRLMGLTVGSITHIEPMPPEAWNYNIYVEFEVRDPYYGYLWTEGSRAKVATADFLGNRVLEVTKGTGGYPTYVFHPLREVTIEEARQLEGTPWVYAEEVYGEGETNLLAKPLMNITNVARLVAAGTTRLRVMNGAETRKSMTAVWNDKEGRYDFYGPNSKYWLLSDESPALTERMERLVGEVEKALPNILSLTNQLSQVFSNVANLTSNLNVVAVNAQPAVSNLSMVLATLDEPGALGKWLIPTNINVQIEGALSNANTTLGNANSTLVTANTNLAVLAGNLNRSLENLARMTSNLNTQVQVNTNMLKGISDAVRHTDELVEGLKRHWLLRSAFKEKKPAPPPRRPGEVLRSPKDAGRRK